MSHELRMAPDRRPARRRFIVEWGRTVETTVTIAFEEQHGKALFTLHRTGFESAKDRDVFKTGWPGLIDSLEKTVAARAGRGKEGT